MPRRVLALEPAGEDVGRHVADQLVAREGVAADRLPVGILAVMPFEIARRQVAGLGKDLPHQLRDPLIAPGVMLEHLEPVVRQSSVTSSGPQALRRPAAHEDP